MKRLMLSALGLALLLGGCGWSHRHHHHHHCEVCCKCPQASASQPPARNP